LFGRGRVGFKDGIGYYQAGWNADQMCTNITIKNPNIVKIPNFPKNLGL
jgi:hypothetical protein